MIWEQFLDLGHSYRSDKDYEHDKLSYISGHRSQQSYTVEIERTLLNFQVFGALKNHFPFLNTKT